MMEYLSKLRLHVMISVIVACIFLMAGSTIAGRYKEGSKQNQQQCQDWCNKQANCSKCSPVLPCPPGMKKLKSWKGYGKNWHACSKPGERERTSQRHKEECGAWCKTHERCGKCFPTPCLAPSKVLKSWTGYGKNWYACEDPKFSVGSHGSDQTPQGQNVRPANPPPPQGNRSVTPATPPPTGHSVM